MRLSVYPLPATKEVTVRLTTRHAYNKGFREMNEIEFIVVVLATFWASFSTTNTVISEINKKRDQIIIGKVDSTSISLEHRKLILESDWQPLYRGLAIRALLFAFILGSLPFIVQKPTPFVIGICVLGAGFSLISVADYIWNSSKDRKHLSEIIAEAESS